MPFASSLQCRVGMYSLYSSQAAHPSRSLSWYSQHEATGSFTTPPPGWNIYRKVTRSPGISYDFPDSSSVPIYTPERKETMREYSKLICPKTQLELCFRANQLTP